MPRHLPRLVSMPPVGRLAAWGWLLESMGESGLGTDVTGVWLMPVWGVVGGMVVAESRRPSGRYTVRTTEEAPRPWRVSPVREPRNDGGPPVVTQGPGAA